MLKVLADSWCAETSFVKKSISSSFFGEYKYRSVILSHWIHISVNIFCLKSFAGLENQSFSSLFPLCIFSNRNLYLVSNYIHQLVIKFLFCRISLLWTSRYVLICCTLLTHFLCCNLFVMFYLTLSVISANVLEIRLPITSIYPFTDGQFHHEYPVTTFYSDFRECSQNSHELPCGTNFYEDFTHFTHLYGLPHESWWLF